MQQCYLLSSFAGEKGDFGSQSRQKKQITHSIPPGFKILIVDDNNGHRKVFLED